MDATSAAALVSAAATAAGSGAAGEAGRHAWESLVGLVRRAAGRDRDAVDPEPAADPTDEAAIRVLVGQVVAGLRSDERFGEALRQWADTHRTVLRVDSPRVSNEVSHGARVTGSVIQISGDVTGDIHLG